MSDIRNPKTFADCYIYGLTDSSSSFNAEHALATFIHTAERIDKSSMAFKNIIDQLKARSQSAVIIRILMQPDVVLCIANKEVMASFKVFFARDHESNKLSKKYFVDVTGLITLKNGFFVCKEIDKLAAYMLGVLSMKIYYTDHTKLIYNGAMQKVSISAFTRLFNSILDYYRLPGYMDNKDKIRYISGVYFGYNVMRLNLEPAQNAASAAVGISRNETKNYDFYYVPEDDLKDINTFITYLAKTFKLDGVTTDTFINSWLRKYGKQTLYGLELYPSFLNILLYAYSGTYINNMKTIENVTARDMVDATNIVLKIGNEMFKTGYKFESAMDREDNIRLMEAAKEEIEIKNICIDCQHEPDLVTINHMAKYAKAHGLALDDPEIIDFINKINSDRALRESFLKGSEEIKNIIKKESAEGVDPNTNSCPHGVTHDALDKSDERIGFFTTEEIKQLDNEIEEDINI